MIPLVSSRGARPLSRALIAVSLACSCGWLANAGLAAAQVPLVREEVQEGPCTLGLQHFARHELEQARPLLERCLAESGERTEILVPLAAAAVQLGDIDAARRYGERAVAQDPQDPDARYWHGRALLRAGDAAAAEAQWEAGLRISSQHIGLLEGMAKLALDRGHHEKAYGLLSQLRLQGTDDAWVHRLLADLTRRKGLWKQSLQHWNDALERAEPTAEDLVVASELSILARQPEAAIEYGRRAVRREPNGMSYNGLGQAFFAADRPESARTALQRAVELDPETPRHRFHLANVLEVLGDTEGAERQFEAYVALEPDDATGYLNYGIHLDRQGRRVEALEKLRRATELDPDLLSARVAQAQILESLGREEDALEVVRPLTERQEAGDQLGAWAERLQAQVARAAASSSEGKVHLLHIVVADSSSADQVERALAGGEDFAALATRFSVGSTAATGGDVGWVSPGDMVEPLRSAIAALKPQDVTPALASRGYVHFFKRVR
ncbi:MAG: tetratricopeptide repeat protein [Candidatus Krumholzibacteriia bacterium]